MARHPNGARAGQKARNRTYTIVVAVLIVGALIAFYYGPFGKNEAEPIDVQQTSLESDTNDAVAVVPEVNDVITLTPPNEVTPEPNPIVSRITETNIPLPRREASLTGEPNLPEPAPIPVSVPIVQPGDEAAALIASAETLMNQGSSGIVPAREKLNEALRMPMSPQQREDVKARLSKLSEQWLYGRAVLPNDPLCESYMVRSGDRLTVIGDKYKVPYEVLMEINHISDARALQAGAPLKVIKGPFHAKVYRSTFTMDIYLQNTYVRSYTVGLGKPGYETPTGLWRVRPGGKAHATSWRDPDTGIVYQPEDKDYPLGSRWIALDGLSGEAKDRDGFGIHGTKEPDQIGKAGSRGCIRMFNGEVIQVYNMLVPGLSRIEVID
ncbi:MAG: L,D-transpeptidase family protein [Sedimentisphaerales bacterium]|nr:L,D-transpeptidase family protein [Sedimentisphaerales bacterium]